MFRLRKLTFVAVLLLLITNVQATQNRDETLNGAAELNDEAVACVKDHRTNEPWTC
ncbi:MAG TPA: hypothetical protein VKB05_11870 [Pyrinomonadaceae bacterium]|nr:hypothetical protein [Pyrinomonadaceae bacterium]